MMSGTELDSLADTNRIWYCPIPSQLMDCSGWASCILEPQSRRSQAEWQTYWLSWIHQNQKLPVMRSHYLWPWKLQNCTIPVSLEAIQTTTITSKLFQLLYLGYNQVLHYIIYGLRLSNFDISLAFTSNQHPQTYLLSSNISSRS